MSTTSSAGRGGGLERGQRLVLLVAAVVAVVGLGIGLAPVSAETAADDSYSCGSAFGEMFGDSEARWLRDSFGAAIDADRGGFALDLDATPDEVCPDKVGGRRTVALVVLAAAVVVAVGGAWAVRGAGR